MLRWACISFIFLLLTGCEEVILNNGIIEVHLSPSGSIAHVSETGGPNLINNHDLGRQIQVSFYAGEDQTHPDQHPEWSPWPWNPIQSGDAYGNQAKMLVLQQTETGVSIVSIPMLWDRDNVPEYGVLLSNTITLIDNVIWVRVELNISDNCKIVNPIPRHQEMPAIYTSGALRHLISGGNEIHNPNNIWGYWEGAEWAGAFGDDGFGLAVYLPDTELFIGGRYENGDDKTTYFSPLRTLTLKPGDTLEYVYYIIVGTVHDVKEAVIMIQTREFAI